MNIAGTDFDLNNKALCIYISGCDGACKGCHNYELWDYNIGVDILENNTINDIIDKINTPMVHNLWVMGGEPLLQVDGDLEYFLWVLRENINCPIWLWTRFYEVPDNIKQYLSYIKVGEYQEGSKPYIEPLFGITLASGNQKIIRV